MKIIFLGTPDFAIHSLEALLNTSWIKVFAVCTQSNKEAGRGQKIKEPPVKKLASERGLLVFQTERISKEVLFQLIKPKSFFKIGALVAFELSCGINFTFPFFINSSALIKALAPIKLSFFDKSTEVSFSSI